MSERTQTDEVVEYWQRIIGTMRQRGLFGERPRRGVEMLPVADAILLPDRCIFVLDMQRLAGISRKAWLDRCKGGACTSPTAAGWRSPWPASLAREIHDELGQDLTVFPHWPRYLIFQEIERRTMSEDQQINEVSVDRREETEVTQQPDYAAAEQFARYVAAEKRLRLVLIALTVRKCR